MKSLLIHNFTKRKLYQIDRFLRKHKLFNVHAVIPGEDFTEEMAALVVRYGLNVIIPLQCVETGHQSVVEIEKRNPGFEQRVLAYPRHKIEIMRRSPIEPMIESIMALGLTFPRVRLRLLHDLGPYDSFYPERQVIEEHALPQLSDEERGSFDILWGEELEINYQMLDFGLLIDLGLVGDEECLLLTKA